MNLDIVFNVNMLISKLPPPWQDYETKLMHEKDNMELNNLMHHLWIKELARNKDKKLEPTDKAHVVEVKPKDRFVPYKKEFKKPIKSKKKPIENPYNKFYCYSCGKLGHVTIVCQSKNNGDNMTVVITEANIVGEEVD